MHRLLLLVFLIGLQQLPLSAQTYKEDLPKLYQQCAKTRSDSAHRLIVSFLRHYEVVFTRKPRLIETPEKFYKFCDEFRALCLQKQDARLLNRLKIIELIDKVKFQKKTAKEVDKAFYQLFDELVLAKDYSAGLSCLLELGLLQGFLNDRLQALKVLFFAEKFAEKHQLQKDIALQSVYRSIGFFLWEVDVFGLSSQYFKKSLATGYATSQDSLVMLNGIGINYQKMNDFATSMQYFEQASKYALHIKNTLFNTIIEGNNAVNYLKTGDLDKAYRAALHYKNVSLQNNLLENALGAIYWLVQIEIKRKDLNHAKRLLDSLDWVVGKVQDSRFVSQRRLKEARYLYYQALKDAEKSLLAYQEFVQADSLFRVYANKNKITELQLTAEVELYAKEMTEKEQEKRRNAWTFGIVISLLSVLTVVLVGYFYRKGKRQDKEIQRLRQQLFAQIQTINQQNENIQTFIPKAIIEQETESLEFDVARIEVKDEDIQHLRNFNLAYKEQWISFKESFLKVYPTFEQNLNEKIGTLSNAELRLLMLHKLGLSNTEIAKTLLISPESVRTGKYRLYKKFGISSNEELDRIL